MNENERINKIMDILYHKSTINNNELEEMFKASSVTIRRDLEKLRKKGLIVRYRGGAMLAKSKFGHEPSLGEREDEFLIEKRAIAVAAAQLIEKGEVIALDIGSTTMELAKAIRSKENITVFTPSIPIASVFYHTNVKVYMVGGFLNQNEMSLGGPIARNVIRQYHYDKFFMGVAGIDEEGGATDFGIDEVETKKAFVERSSDVIVLADSSKLGKKSFIEIIRYPIMRNIITDSSSNCLIRKKIQERGVNVMVADSSSMEFYNNS